MSASTYQPGLSWRGGALRLYHRVGFLPVVLLALIVLLSLTEPRFLHLVNIFNVLRSAAFLMIVAAGQMLVLIVGGFDLSIGAVVALTCVVSAITMATLRVNLPGHDGLVILCGVLAGLGCGLAVGIGNGACVALLRISPFMVTLGTMSIASGVALILTSGIPVYGMPPAFVQGFGRALWFGLPTAVYIAFAAIAAIFVLQNFTKAGRYLHAIGGNMHAAVVSGVSARRYLVLAYVLSSMLASVTALLLTAQIGSGQASVGDALTLESIAAAVIAGVSLRGGVGRVELVALGAIFLPILTNAMDLMHINTKIQMIFLGIIIVAAVALDQFGKARRARD